MVAASSSLLLAAALLSPAGAEAPPETGASTVAALVDLVPAHHPLRGFAGEVAWYGHRPYPELRYQQPDFEAWASGLEKATIDPGRDHFTAIWRTADGALRYVLSRAEHVRLFTVEEDTIEFEDPGFHTQVGVARWGWEYREGLLRTHRTWRLALSPSGTDRPTGPPAPSALFAVTTYEYRKGATVPHHSRTYWSEADRRAGRWGQRTWYGPDGKRKKTRHNPERPYPY